MRDIVTTINENTRFQGDVIDLDFDKLHETSDSKKVKNNLINILSRRKQYDQLFSTGDDRIEKDKLEEELETVVSGISIGDTLVFAIENKYAKTKWHLHLYKKLSSDKWEYTAEVRFNTGKYVKTRYIISDLVWNCCDRIKARPNDGSNFDFKICNL